MLATLLVTVRLGIRWFASKMLNIENEFRIIRPVWIAFLCFFRWWPTDSSDVLNHGIKLQYLGRSQSHRLMTHSGRQDRDTQKTTKKVTAHCLLHLLPIQGEGFWWPHTFLPGEWAAGRCNPNRLAEWLYVVSAYYSTGTIDFRVHSEQKLGNWYPENFYVSCHVSLLPVL